MNPPEAAKPPRRTRNLIGVLAFLGKYPRPVALSLSFLLVIISIDMALPRVLGEAINNLRWHIERGATFAPATWGQLFFSLVLIRAGLAVLLGPIRNRLVQRTLGDVRASIFDAMQRLPFQYHDKAKTGELISRSTTDVWRLQDFFFACLLLTLDIIVTLVATIALIFLISPLLGWITLATVVPTVALISFYAAKLQPKWREVHDLHGAMTTVVQENIAGVRVVKAFARESAEVSKFRGRRDEFLKTLLSAVNYWASRVPLTQLIFGLSVPLALWLGGRQVIEGDLAIGDLATVIFYLMAIGHRVGLVGQFTQIIQNAGASAERVLEVIHEPQPLKDGSRELPEGWSADSHVRTASAQKSKLADKAVRAPATRGGEVRFEHVSFQYRDGKASLTDISFVAQPGQTVAVVGPTGSGKTTLVNLIPRFYDVNSGVVRLEGVDVRELKLASLRRSVSIIFQETFLFSTTVAENIAYGNPHASREAVEAAARLAQAHEFIEQLENGYETVIGERGVSLSGGQRQRIAIARAFLMNPRILIFDDATASVDAHTERLIQEAMRTLAAGRTTFVIAHRFSTLKHADVILVLKDGRLVQSGSHDELIRCGGFFSEIIAQQIKP